MADQVITLRITADGTAAVIGIKTVEAELGKVGATGKDAGAGVAAGMDKATAETRKFGAATQATTNIAVRSHKRMADGVASISTQLNRLQRYVGLTSGLAASGAALASLAHMPDAYTTLPSPINQPKNIRNSISQTGCPLTFPIPGSPFPALPTSATIARYKGDGIPPRTAARLMMPTRAGQSGARRCHSKTSAPRAGFPQLMATRGVNMAFTAFLFTGCGAFFGACLRYAFGIVLNPVFPTIPLGTLAANLLGGLIIGVMMALIAQFQALSPELRLFVVTGFLGGLTTFSAFSAETVTLLLRREYVWVLGIIGAHLIGSLLMTLLGFFLVQTIARIWT